MLLGVIVAGVERPLFMSMLWMQMLLAVIVAGVERPLFMSMLWMQMLLAVIVAKVQRPIQPVNRHIKWLFLCRGQKNLSTGVSLTSFS